MVKLSFKNPALEKLFRNFKWARNNTLQMFDVAREGDILDYKSPMKKFEAQPILRQFQCIVTTTNTQYRNLIGHKNLQFGVLVAGNKTTQKKDISTEVLRKTLKSQLTDLETVLKTYGAKELEDNILTILSIVNHEFMHHGELILMFRESGIDLPERFRKAFAL